MADINLNASRQVAYSMGNFSVFYNFFVSVVLTICMCSMICCIIISTVWLRTRMINNALQVESG